MEFHKEDRGHSQSQSTLSKESGGSYSHNNNHREKETRRRINAATTIVEILAVAQGLWHLLIKEDEENIKRRIRGWLHAHGS